MHGNISKEITLKRQVVLIKDICPVKRIYTHIDNIV